MRNIPRPRPLGIAVAQRHRDVRGIIPGARSDPHAFAFARQYRGDRRFRRCAADGARNGNDRRLIPRTNLFCERVEHSDSKASNVSENSEISVTSPSDCSR
jgi:hypothetical protein